MTDIRKGSGRTATSSFLALGCVGFIASAPAVAQDLGEPTRLEGVVVSDEVVEDSYKVEEVSSPKFTAPLVDTPRIVNVITEEVLEDTAAFSLEEAFRTVPGITLGAGEGGPANADIPLIRGVDATGDVFVDGVRDVGSQSREVFALERIEVSKGPSTAFGGRGAAAGAINLVSKVARRGESASMQFTAGTSDLIRITGDVNGELSEDVVVRLVGMFHDSEVPGRDAVYEDRWGVAPSITLFQGPVTASLDYYHLESDALPDYGVPTTSPGQLPGGVREPADVDFDNFYGLLARDFQRTNVDAVTLQVDVELGGGLVLSNVTRYSDARNNYIVTNPDSSAGNVQNGFVWRSTRSRNSQSDGIVSNTNLSAVFETGAITHSVAAGFEYNDTDSRNRNYSVDTGSYRFDPDIPGSGCDAQAIAEGNCTPLANPDPSDPWTGAITPSETPALASGEEYSFYLFDTVTLSPSLLLNGGVRWTDFSASGSGCGRGGCFDAENEGSFWSYQGGAIFKPTELTSLYLSYANSKSPPGTTIGEGAENLSGNNQFFEPQETENWEAGAKAELFNRNLLLTGAIFRVERKNILQRDPTGEVTEIISEGRIEGFEVGASGAVGPVSMLVGYTYLDTDLPQTSEHNLAATVDWQATPQFSIGAGAYAASERFADSAALIRADGYVRFDAHAQYDFGESVGVRVNVNNITDKRYVAKLRNPHFAIPADGRQAIVSLVVRY